MPLNDLQILLKQHLQQADIVVTPEQVHLLAQYVELLFKWNAIYNLTASSNPESFITDHIIDSLVIGPYLQGDNIIDVGTGAGLPGIVLAIYYPDKQFTLLEIRSKRVRFLQMVISTLKLKNVNIVNQRVEQYDVDDLFTTVVTRAFSSLKEMLQMTGHLCHPNGLFLAMKGRYPTTELAEIPNTFNVVFAKQLSVPGLNKERHVIGIQHKETLWPK